MNSKGNLGEGFAIEGFSGMVCVQVGRTGKLSLSSSLTHYSCEEYPFAEGTKANSPKR